MKPWRSRGEVLEVTLEPHELRLLSDLTTQLSDVFELVRDGRAHAEDPVIARLFPAAYDDAEDAAEFRRLTIDDAAEGRLSHLATMQEDITASLSAPEPGALGIRVDHVRDWLTGITDLRLVLHERLQQKPEAIPSLTANERGQLRRILDWLGYLQESLLQALDKHR